MDAEFIDLTAENLAGEHLCCIIRSKKPHPGMEAKRQWLSEQLALSFDGTKPKFTDSAKSRRSQTRS